MEQVVKRFTPAVEALRARHANGANVTVVLPQRIHDAMPDAAAMTQGRLTLGNGEVDGGRTRLHAPLRIGALWVRDGVKIGPLIQGGGQEGGLRSGTLSPTLPLRRKRASPAHPAASEPTNIRRQKSILVSSYKAIRLEFYIL